MPYNLPCQGNRSLPQIALDVHMTTTGAYERPDAKQQSDIGFLKYKLDNWEPSCPKTSFPFDEAVHQMVCFALFETQ